ncbi:phage SPO1 DNA polymerase--like protein [Caballeronia sordidicola]|uniref:Type-4 uracil-DNA glycosylase n=1 Tax=Caballeronia sordidicola TaxID=196367 RepID=A0A158ES59_CABSO|nr:uracil-DNA glycosylase family protein [Caballeronia sordidicola]SAL10346.1 phage SPO1 DNA polymerase--like protein [Caballeronia sordidicola]
MALRKSMLDEFGLGTIWVRRGAQPVESAGVVDSVVEAASSAPRHNAGEASETLGALDAALTAAQQSHGIARQAPPVKTRPAPQETPVVKSDSLEPPVFDDIPWLDDLPAHKPPEPEITDDTANDIASLDWDALASRVSVCERCKLCERRTNAVFGVGDRDADWMLIGEAPGENEDKLGEPFVGQAGKLLDSMLHAVALSREDNVFIANVIKCRPPGNRNPEVDEVARCEPYLKRQVELVKPKLIVALGRFAAQSLLRTEASIASLRGRVHDYQGVPVIVTYHPAYLLRSLPDKAKAWADLCLAQATYRESQKVAGGA